MEAACEWYSNLVQGESDLAILSLWIGAASLFITFAGIGITIYTVVRARRASDEAKEVVERLYRDSNYQNLASAHSKLSDEEIGVLDYFQRKGGMTRKEITTHPELSRYPVRELLNSSWLIDESGKIVINPERELYLKVAKEN